MKLISAVKEHIHYALKFERTMPKQKDYITVKFTESYKGFDLLDENQTATTDLLSNLIQNLSHEEYMDFPLNPDERLKAIPFHIPSKEIREMFRVCFSFFAAKVALPAQISFSDHPQYPLTMITFNYYETRDGVVQNIALTILEAISNAYVEVVVDKEEKKEDEEMDALDDIDNTEIVEMDFSEELNAQLKDVPHVKFEKLMEVEEDD